MTSMSLRPGTARNTRAFSWHVSQAVDLKKFPRRKTRNSRARQGEDMGPGTLNGLSPCHRTQLIARLRSTGVTGRLTGAAPAAGVRPPLVTPAKNENTEHGQRRDCQFNPPQREVSVSLAKNSRPARNAVHHREDGQSTPDHPWSFVGN